MNEHIVAIKETVKSIIQQMDEARSALHSVLADKTIPLEERWELFCETPKDMLNEQSYIVHFSTYDFSWYDDFYCERHQTMYMADLIDNIEYAIEDYDENYEYNKGYEKFFKDKPEKLDELKEEILADALYSFEFDW